LSAPRLAKIWQGTLASAYIGDVRFAILGPTELSVEGRPVPLGGPKQRALLAFLLLHANKPVSRDRLIDALWGDSPPPSASESLDTYIYRLRKLVGHDRLARRGSGYLLSAEPGELDAGRFELLVAKGSQAADAGDSRGAATMLADALALWRGPALADVLYQPFASAPARQLEGRRLEALESRIEAELDCGAGAALVPELEQLVADYPLRERLVASLMMALYQAGRQADALAAFRAARGRMVEELGLEPGPEVCELQERILRHDPALAAPRVTDPRAIRPVRPRGRWSWRWAAAAALASLAIAVAVPVLLRPGPARGGVLANGVGEVTAAGGVVRSLDLPSQPGAVVAAFGSIWVASPAANEVYRIDPVTGSLVQTIPVGSGPGAITAAAGNIWVANTLDGTVSRISAASQVIQTIAVGTEPTGITAGGGAIWVADAAASTLSALSPASGRLTTTVALPSAPFGVAFGAGSVWVTSPADDSLTRVDPRGGRVSQQIPVGAEPTAVTFGLGSVWVANSLDSTVTRVSPSTDAVAAVIPVGMARTRSRSQAARCGRLTGCRPR
jgi:DNA-binding SARP family transcriptional activator